MIAYLFISLLPAQEKFHEFHSHRCEFLKTP